MNEHDSPRPATPIRPADAGHAPVPAAPLPAKSQDEKPAPDPTRYGDWEKNGRCIDF